ncbi:MAG: autotransporter-associated beta strand repeat-containing protein [Pseudolabrys sp.]
MIVADAIADQTGSGGTGVNAGSWGVIKTGTGTLTLSNANTYSGGTTVTGGTLTISNNSALGSGAVSLQDGTTLQLNGVQIANIVNVSGDPDIPTDGASSMPTFVGPAGTVVNVLGVNNMAATDVLTVTTANATYAGATNVGGTAPGGSVTLKGGALNAFGGTSAVSVFAGSVLDLGGFNQAIGSLSGAGAVTDNGAAAGAHCWRQHRHDVQRYPPERQRHARPHQDRQRHADAVGWHQQLYRRHDGRCRHAPRERCADRLQHHRECERHARRHRQCAKRDDERRRIRAG